MTQFGRSLHALNIDIMCANTPQAKGRVERANKTLQDRLVKELRLRGSARSPPAMNCCRVSWPITTPASARRRQPQEPPSAIAAGDDLADVFAWREERTVSKSLTLQYDKVVFLLEPNDQAKLRPQARHRRRLSRRPAGDPLPRRRPALHHLRQAAAGFAGRDRREQAPRRRLSPYPRAADRAGGTRSPKAPRRRDQPDARLFKVG